MKKEVLCGTIGVIGGYLSSLLGGWSGNMTTLMMFMAIDFMLGLMVAAVFKNSSKTDSGALSSNVCWKGLMKKGGMLLVVVVGYRIDLIMNTSYIRDMIILSFIVNELISITELLGLMGVDLPPVVTKAIDILTKKSNDDKEE